MKRDSRLPWAFLGFAMLASLAVCLHVTRGTTFSGDELTWVAFSPGMDLKVALEPHSGHLALVSHLLYKFVLETIGSSYLTFRLLTLFTVFLSVAFFFVWARRRIGDWLTLAPCLVLIFFGSDAGHILQGNGFTIMLAIACGMAALVALDRNSRGGDIACCAALCLGTITYTVALPFIVGVAVIVLVRSDRWKRAWIFLIPAAIYVAWRVWVLVYGVDLTRGELDIVNILLFPAWIFQSLSGILSALTGLNYNFAGGGWVEPTAFAGPALALAFALVIGWRIGRGRNSVVFWGLMAVALAMFLSQVLTYIPGVREPGTSRYLYPGAFVVLILAIEAFRRFEVSRPAFVAIWLVALTGFGANLTIIRDSGAALRDRAHGVEIEMTAAALVNSMGFYPPGPNATPLAEMVESPAISIIGTAARRYGGLGVPEGEIASLNPDERARIDSILTGAVDPTLTPVGPGLPAVNCSRAGSFPGGVRAANVLPGGGLLRAARPGTIRIARFADEITTVVGNIQPGVPAILGLPDDGNSTPWKLASTVPFEVCDLPR